MSGRTRYDPVHHRRHAMRLRSYDYASGGAYFVTMCVQGKERLLGDVEDEGMRLNDAGRMVEEWWRELEQKFSDTRVDAFIVMPNHVHGIIIRLDARQPVGADLRVRTVAEGAHIGALQEIMQWLKTMTTNAYIRGVKTSGWEPFSGKLWQRSHHDRIVRDERELDGIREYIRTNPVRWATDDENPQAGRLNP